MKKTILLLLFIQSGCMIAQTETVVTINGKILTFNPTFSSAADNGLTLSTPTNVQLGGTLTKPTVLATTSTFTLAIKGLTPKGSINQLTDNVVMSDNNGILKTIKPAAFNTEPWYNAVDNTRATQNTQDIYMMGNVGIGQTAPTTKLDIKSSTPGAVKIADGTQAPGYILTSDANGVASWKPNTPAVKFVNGTVPQTQLDLNTSNPTYFGSSITLPPGSWSILVGILIAPKIGYTNAEPNTNYVSKFILSDQTTTISEATFSYITPNKYAYNTSSTGPRPAPNALFNKGNIRITTTLPQTTIYLLSIATGLATGSVIKNDAENYFYAIKINPQ